MRTIEKDLFGRFAGVAKTVEDSGSLTLREYSAGQFIPAFASLQPRDDILSCLSTYATRLLGERTGERLVENLSEIPTLLTANHHGVDYRALTIQGTLIFSLHRLLGDFREAPGTIVVLACGTVPMGNFTFPMGISLSRTIGNIPVISSNISGTHRINIFSWKASQTLVSKASAISQEMVNRAMRQVYSKKEDGLISEAEAKTLENLLIEDYSNAAVMARADYSDQSVLLNSRVWKKMFSSELDDCVPEIVYLEMEKVTSELIISDLQNKESLYYNLLFDPLLRETAIESLDCVPGCWELSRLHDIHDTLHQRKLSSDEYRGCGTMLFWAVGRKGQRIPLFLKRQGGALWFTGLSSSESFSFPLEIEDICLLLRRRLILPSLFSSFCVMSLARGFSCSGGFLQADYLPAMRSSLARALRSWGNDQWACLIEGVPTGSFVCGLTAVLAQYPEGCYLPAGAVEIIAAGGLRRSEIEQMGNLTLREANFCGMLYNYNRLFDWGESADLDIDRIGDEILAKIGSRVPRIAFDIASGR